MPRGSRSDLLSLRDVGRRAAASPTSPSLARLSVFSAWDDAAGPALRAVSRPVTCSDGRLVVEVSDATWCRELDRLREPLLDLLREKIPSGISSLSFRLRRQRSVDGAPDGEVREVRGARAAALPAPPPPRRAAPSPDEREPADPASPAATPSDGGLERRFGEVAERYLGARVRRTP